MSLYDKFYTQCKICNRKKNISIDVNLPIGIKEISLIYKEKLKELGWIADKNFKCVSSKM